MARYTGPVCRLCRREGTKLFLKGERCYTPKCSVDRRGYPPGQHGQGRKRVSEYALHLREKQKARRTYGVLERQFRRYYDLAARRRGITGENLLQLLETRLDNVVYRLGFASSRPEARQLVLHGHFSVNGRKVSVPSYQVRPGDVVAVREGSRNLDKFKANLEVGRTPPPWMTLDVEKMEGEILSLPTRDQIDVPVQEHLIVEYYSR
ncbi:MAG: 30S ribosomal protein S4 [Firmicutes bacterium]|jgi:small subunit ribosomal protein S4|nr:30S ribosomal protein S4 [Bacillota bacterium]